MADIILPLSPLPEPPNRKMADQERFDEAAYQSLKAQQKLVDELNRDFTPAFNAALPAVKDAFENRTIIHAAAGNAQRAEAGAARADEAADTARLWAEAPEGQLVDARGHSALHWAKTAEDIVTSQIGRVETAANEAVVTVQSEGAGQINAVQLAGNAAVTRVMDSTGAAQTAAAEAKTAAQQAVSMTGVGPAGKAKFGFVRVGDGLNVTADGTLSAAFVSVVSTPSVTFPATVGIGYANTLGMTASTAIPSGRIVRFEVAFADQPSRDVPATNGAGSLTITPTGTAATVLLVVRAIDSEGNVSKDLVQTISQVNVTKNAPGITQPANGATNVPLDTASISVQAASLVGLTGTPCGTQIQVAADAAFATIVADTGASGGYRTSWPVGVSLTRSTKYYVRARHQWTVYGWSNWGAVSTFTSEAAVVSPLTITAPANNAVNVSLAPVVTLSAFANTGPRDTPSATRIDIATDAAFASLVATYNGAYTTTWTCSPPLKQSTRYYLRARHSGSRFGDGAWTTSSCTTAVVTATVEPPTLTILTSPNPTVTLSVNAPSGAVTSKRLEVYQGGTRIWQSADFSGSTVQIGVVLARGTVYTLAPYAYAGSWSRGTDRVMTMASTFVGDKVEITTSGSWTPPVSGTYKVLLVGGGGYGGGGASDAGESGGGGSGFVVLFDKQLVTSSSYPITVGGPGLNTTAFDVVAGAGGNWVYNGPPTPAPPTGTGFTSILGGGGFSGGGNAGTSAYAKCAGGGGGGGAGVGPGAAGGARGYSIGRYCSGSTYGFNGANPGEGGGNCGAGQGTALRDSITTQGMLPTTCPPSVLSGTDKYGLTGSWSGSGWGAGGGGCDNRQLWIPGIQGIIVIKLIAA